MKRKEIFQVASAELDRAQKLYPSFNSNHEGYAVLKEEVDELWDAIKKSKGVKANPKMISECIQIIAMAARFIEDLS